MQNRVKELREYLGFTTRELANEAKTGASTISEVENSKRVPNVILAIRIARALNTTTEYLWGEDIE